MKKKYIIFALVLALFFGGVSLISAQEEDTPDPELEQLLLQLQALREQIQELQQQIQNLRAQQRALQQEIFQLTRELQEGMQGADVEALQELLATDPEIYPEGLVTGYFGPLTKGAVKRFQKMAGIEQAGRVGPQTLVRVNQILCEGVGKKGHIPPGLLKSPGINRLLGGAHPHYPFNFDYECVTPTQSEIFPPNGFVTPGQAEVFPQNELDEEEEEEEE